jgi:hypothetical protein
MENKAYILSFDRNPAWDYKILHEGIKSDPNIVTWSHYMLSSYILISKQSGKVLGEGIMRYFPDHRFLLTQVKLSNKWGLLNKDAWEWIDKYKNI